VEGCSLRESLRFAVGVGRGCTALFPGREAPVDTVSVGVVGDDEHASLGLRRRREAEAEQCDKTDQNCPHYGALVNFEGAAPGVDPDNVRKIVKRCLTFGRAAQSPFFSCVLHGLRPDLDGADATNHCAAMNGLNHICGICREIIR
jgi:hypothetical protein